MNDDRYVWLVEQTRDHGYNDTADFPIWVCESEEVAHQMIETAVAVYKTRLSVPGSDEDEIGSRVQRERWSYTVSRMRVVCRGKAATP